VGRTTEEQAELERAVAEVLEIIRSARERQT